LVEAGAQHVWAGYRLGAEGVAALEELAGRYEQVSLVLLDVTSQESVEQAATGVATQVDVVVSNAQVSGGAAAAPVPDAGSARGPKLGVGSGPEPGLGSRGGLEMARAAMDVHYFGLLRLAAEFAPAMRERAASPDSTVTAWVNLLSIYALSSFPQESVLSAAYAAAHSFSQSLRAQMLAAGIRVVNVFPGPLAPASVAVAIVESLRAGVEDVYPGDVAQEWFSTWRANPKVLERELSVPAEPQR
jgi:NAD(P)-dependent dehydrogenase (short-subunit alcohol dehydrogenase family)